MEMNQGGLNLHNVSLAITAGLPTQLIKYGVPQVAFSGRSNVGKSSLVNSLLGRKKLARVSGEPGKTITVNYYEVDKKLFLVDLPGYGYARRSKEDTKKWSGLTQSYFGMNSVLRLVLQLVDIKVGLTDTDLVMLDYLHYYNVPYIVVATKCDKLNKTDLTTNVRRLLKDPALRPGTDIILYSAVKNIGRDDLWSKIIQYTITGDN
ncbi:MAG: YihA family ribosome biogenesis GTP-binding protein [Firmicutes bacterium HGW-Firmicutes-21]|nr:MAG: YihA family ribosome biogenesis GTP-binding protein [Firmicutes bacterium HGW-Firmicutes-21]